jgi:DNA-binding response OmpR family regulator
MQLDADPRYAVVIEAHHPLAEGVADSLRKRGYVVGIAGTHASGAAWAASRPQIDFLVASVPVSGESPGAHYLANARGNALPVGMVILLSTPDEQVGDAPRHAVKIEKPFSLLELEAAIDRALAAVESPDASPTPASA